MSKISEMTNAELLLKTRSSFAGAAYLEEIERRLRPHVLLIDTAHHPLRDEDYAANREAIAEADVVIHTFTPYKAEVVKGDAELTDVRQLFDGSFERWDKTHEDVVL